ncbi:MAG: KH domain-containing protein [Anaerolineae bacterium]|nr:KH domain-containing protein [Thermoplasmata archaeon]NIV34212.1 KH domain-containing protein [Anaerolineae bacterium]NIY06061.1 KH domain-containing protein [Thermoplasmata archaeon]
MKLSQEQLSEIREWVLTTIRWCVTHPESCQVDIHPHEGSTVIDVAPHPDDFRYLVGTEGRTANAIRTIFSIFNRRYNHNVVFHVMEVEAQKKRRQRRHGGQSSTNGGDENKPRRVAGDDT